MPYMDGMGWGWTGEKKGSGRVGYQIFWGYEELMVLYKTKIPVKRRVPAVDKMNIQTIDSCFSAWSIGLLEWSYGAMLVQLAIRPARLALDDFGNSNELQVAQRTQPLPNMCVLISLNKTCWKAGSLHVFCFR